MALPDKLVVNANDFTDGSYSRQKAITSYASPEYLAKVRVNVRVYKNSNGKARSSEAVKVISVQFADRKWWQFWIPKWVDVEVL